MGIFAYGVHLRHPGFWGEKNLYSQPTGQTQAPAWPAVGLCAMSVWRKRRRGGCTLTSVGRRIAWPALGALATRLALAWGAVWTLHAAACTRHGAASGRE